jgi:hypothetical protein
VNASNPEITVHSHDEIGTVDRLIDHHSQGEDVTERSFGCGDREIATSGAVELSFPAFDPQEWSLVCGKPPVADLNGGLLRVLELGRHLSPTGNLLLSGVPESV